MRESPWGPLSVVDAHVHFFSPRFFELLASQKPGLTADAALAQLGWTPPVNLAEVWIAELNRHNVAGAALIASIPGDESSVVEAATAHPGRLHAFAMVNPRNLKLDALSGVAVACLFPAMHGFSIQDECVKPVLEWARANHRAVFVHCGVLSVGVRKKLGLASPYDMRYSNPIDLHAVALRYPDVSFIVPHFGAGYFREVLMLADLCPNVYLETSSSNQWMKYQEAHINLRQVFKRALDVVGAKRLLFGTDSSFFPRGWQHSIFEEQATALYELDLSAADAALVFGQNLLRVLGSSAN